MKRCMRNTHRQSEYVRGGFCSSIFGVIARYFLCYDPQFSGENLIFFY